jgi:hypothetical protein
VTDRIDDFQGHHLVGQQLQRPVSVAGRRFAQSHRNQLRLGLTIELARRGRLRAFLAVQGRFKAFGDQALAEVLDGLHTAIEGLGDLDIRPSRPVSIRLEQDLGAAKPLRRSLELLEDLLTNGTLFIRQPDDVLLDHGTPPRDGKCPNNPRDHQPHFLPLKTH